MQPTGSHSEPNFLSASARRQPQRSSFAQKPNERKATFAAAKFAVAPWEVSALRRFPFWRVDLHTQLKMNKSGHLPAWCRVTVLSLVYSGRFIFHHLVRVIRNWNTIPSGCALHKVHFQGVFSWQAVFSAIHPTEIDGNVGHFAALFEATSVENKMST